MLDRMLSDKEHRKIWSKFLFWDIKRTLKGNAELRFNTDINEYSIKIWFNKKCVVYLIDEALTLYIKNEISYRKMFYELLVTICKDYTNEIIKER